MPESPDELTPSSGPYTYCPYCTAPLESNQDPEGSARLVCPGCGWIHYRNPTAGVAVILLSDEGLWLGRRRSGGWCIPCGHVEWDETIRSAAVREMREELGVEIELGELFDAHSNFHDPAHHTVGIWFEAALPPGAKPRPGGDLAEVRLFPLEKLPELIFPTDRLIVERLRRLHSAA